MIYNGLILAKTILKNKKHRIKRCLILYLKGNYTIIVFDLFTLKQRKYMFYGSKIYDYNKLILFTI
jgi:hypothetical protein